MKWLLIFLSINMTTSSAFLHGQMQIIRVPIKSTSAFSIPVGEEDVHDLQAELNAEGLSLCHGILHSSGVREMTDLIHLTDVQMVSLGIDSFDTRNINRIKESMAKNHRNVDGEIAIVRELNTVRDGAFDRKALSRFEVEEKHNFDMKTICSDNEVYSGKLFSVKQCEHLNRMSEHYAYSQIGTINSGWTDQIYTLTAQHMACKDVPGMIPRTRLLMRQLFQELYVLFPEIVPGSICFENDGEPHLVKYNGKAKGTIAHTDNSEFKFITVNAMLSADNEYTGGGTHITNLDKTIRLQQGEMLIHLGDLEHAGAEIRSGVRRIFIAFLACEWKDKELNKPIIENARDYVG
eukprot:scaffold8100_cov66-Cyclotella_meneghiniana.AAC.2